MKKLHGIKVLSTLNHLQERFLKYILDQEYKDRDHEAQEGLRQGDYQWIICFVVQILGALGEQTHFLFVALENLTPISHCANCKKTDNCQVNCNTINEIRNF